MSTEREACRLVLVDRVADRCRKVKMTMVFSSFPDFFSASRFGQLVYRVPAPHPVYFPDLLSPEFHTTRDEDQQEIAERSKARRGRRAFARLSNALIAIPVKSFSEQRLSLFAQLTVLIHILGSEIVDM